MLAVSDPLERDRHQSEAFRLASAQPGTSPELARNLCRTFARLCYRAPVLEHPQCPHDRPHSESPGLIPSNHCQTETDSARFDGETSPDARRHEDSLFLSTAPFVLG
ncbi:hypothetical protein QBC32DRAFT_330431 [Pseudoneurospora amorphoporcata]|uniref:Uncharacterized protein n=1 Tax=Pseudoneurospora amorphoporcata TaxID=241081 RepID=A0AAN6SKF4_9PEZI|nr:hypothetical protein QBC32DRAFT_330431 [Pseudoneurospora amorphoporcata]